MFGTVSEFMKLERIEIGGIKGKALSQHVLQLFEEFNAVFRDFTSIKYDCMDPLDKVGQKKMSIWPFKFNSLILRPLFMKIVVFLN